jgi:aldehyde:ferredoxin oxidoreductase
MGIGTRKDDLPPYRSMGPVTREEYLSRQQRYDKQLKDIVGVETKGKTIEEKMGILRKYREEQYEKLCDAVYKRRGWTENAIPTVEHLKELGIDYPEAVEVVKKYL